jgi:ribosomal protein S27AE
MEYLVWQSLVWSVRAFWWAALIPLAGARRVYRGIARVAGASALVTHDVLACPSCGNAVSLVGRWQCGRCGYVFDGFAFARCAVCRSVPPYLPRSFCGAGLRNPTHAPPAYR